MEPRHEKRHQRHPVCAFKVRGSVETTGEILEHGGLISIYRFEIVKLTSDLLFRNLALVLTVHIIVFG